MRRDAPTTDAGGRAEAPADVEREERGDVVGFEPAPRVARVEVGRDPRRSHGFGNRGDAAVDVEAD
jgi:hypothetical protein